MIDIPHVWELLRENIVGRSADDEAGTAADELRLKQLGYKKVCHQHNSVPQCQISETLSPCM